MKLDEIAGKEKAKSADDLIASIKDGVFTKDGRHLKVIDYFYIVNKNLTSLEGCPQEIGDEFDCFDNKITSLVGGPKKVGGYFSCEHNRLTSLVGCPKKVGGHFTCDYNHDLTSLEWCPQEIGGDFYCSHNRITSLKDIHKRLKKMFGGFYVRETLVKSHVLGLLKIPGCMRVSLPDKKVEKIVNKYLPLGDIFDCQEELIEAGFEEYAQL